MTENYKEKKKNISNKLNNDKNIYTIASYRPFLDSVASGILDQVAGDPIKLSDYTIVVPDSETGFALREAFVGQLHGKTYIMPNIEIIGKIDKEHLSLKIFDDKDLLKSLMDFPSPVSKLHRQLFLSQEILKIPYMASSTQKAIKLGGELGKFIDELQRYNVSFENIGNFVPNNFKEQWSKTADFLKIVTEAWPKKLEDLGKSDPELYKNKIIDIQTEYWRKNKSDNPIIAIGFNETTPAVKKLLNSIASINKGAVILQGFDKKMDTDSWNALTSVHPQYIFKKLLEDLGVSRLKTIEWKSEPIFKNNFARATNIKRTNLEREKLLREAMRPSGTAESWNKLTSVKETKSKKKIIFKKTKESRGINPQALNGMDLITCNSAQEEASVIALKLRETLELEGRRAMFVTPDRSLARRVSSHLKKWDIIVPDDAGLPLSETSVGIYLLATASMAAEDLAPIPMLEALKHPLAAMGEDKSEFRRKLSELEDLVFHGPRPDSGIKGIKGVLSAKFNRHARRPIKSRILKRDMRAFVSKLEKIGGVFFDKMSSTKSFPFSEILDEHINFIEALSNDHKNTGANRIWSGEDGKAAAVFLSSLREEANLISNVNGRDYLGIIEGLMRDVNVRSKYKSHSNLKITTPRRASLLKSDVVILGGVNDEKWPEKSNENSWLSPKMIKALNMPEPEKNIGVSAYNFVQLLSNPNVLITRATRNGNAPTVSSPFLMRLMMVLKKSGLEDNFENKTRLLDIHKAMNTPSKVEPIAAPYVTPAVSKRPKQLPVTAVESLMRDPYAVYTKYILKLKPKASIDSRPSVAERGNFTHDALDEFVKKYPDELPENAEEELLKIGRDTFKKRINNPTVRSFWWPRFEMIAKWFVKFEKDRREISKTLATEVQGKLEIDLGDRIFTLTAIADRIDRDENDRIEVIDYKTGAVPMQKAVGLGFSPQLTLEALIAYTGGFDGLEASDVGGLQYWKLSGGRPAAKIVEVRGDVKKLSAEARVGIEELMKAFNKKSTPYLVSPRKEWEPRYSNSRHLSRVDEWKSVKKSTPPPVNSNKKRKYRRRKGEGKINGK